MLMHIAAYWLLVVAAGEPAVDRAAIQKVLDDQAAAWNHGDLKRFMAGYWKSDQLSFFSGNKKTAGWDATFERYRKAYQAEGKEMGKLAFEELSIELLGDGHALVRGRFRLRLAKETATGIFTLILRRFPEGWRIVHDHTSSQ
jgi:beta-aspartyl-peptidase (threonine type)